MFINHKAIRFTWYLQFIRIRHTMTFSKMQLLEELGWGWVPNALSFPCLTVHLPDPAKQSWEWCNIDLTSQQECEAQVAKLLLSQ